MHKLEHRMTLRLGGVIASFDKLFWTLCPRPNRQVVERENVRAAYRSVRRNGGAPGIDGMNVEDLGR